jgi:hypothetical protein
MRKRGTRPKAQGKTKEKEEVRSSMLKKRNKPIPKSNASIP